MHASGINKSATTTQVWLAEDAKTQPDDDSDGFVIKESTVGDRESIKPVASERCRNCKHSRTMVIIGSTSQDEAVLMMRKGLSQVCCLEASGATGHGRL